MDAKSLAETFFDDRDGIFEKGGEAEGGGLQTSAEGAGVY